MTRSRPKVARPLGSPRRVLPGQPVSDSPPSESAHAQASNRAPERVAEGLPTKAPAESYEPTAYERKVKETYMARQKEKPPAPRLRVSEKGGGTMLVPNRPDPSIAGFHLLEALGSRDPDFLDGLLKQLCNIGSHGRSVDEEGLNFMLSIVKGTEPRDQVDAMLAAQMAAVHNATLTFARRLNHVENIPQQDSAERAFNKLARTFAAQVEALKRYRSSGEQTMRVEHVTVNHGGQAIVGNVSHRGEGTSEKAAPTS
jgi:hypothetical protein